VVTVTLGTQAVGGTTTVLVGSGVLVAEIVAEGFGVIVSISGVCVTVGVGVALFPVNGRLQARLAKLNDNIPTRIE
jgi:hypothetical protein